MQKDSTQEGLLCLRDVRRLAVLAGGAIAAVFVPQRFDPKVIQFLRAVHRTLFPKALDRLAEKIATALPPNAGRDPRALSEEYTTMRLEDMWGRVRGLRRFGWRPDIEIEGLQHVHEALERGRGVILWSMRFSSTTAIKQALFHAGLPMTHLSRRDHGSPSKTSLGVGIVGPLYCRAENAYLTERVRIPLDGSLGYLNTLRQRLRENGCISIFGEHEGLQSAEVSVLGARWRFALGAPSLAWLEDAQLLTAYALRTAPSRYRVVIEKPIKVDRSLPRKVFATRALEEFAARLERLIIAYPGQWQGWLYRSFEGDMPKRSSQRTATAGRS